jgi:hypothetical protein
MIALITKSGSQIIIDSFTCAKLGTIKKAEIDMTPYTGKHVRVWLDLSGVYSLDPKSGHYWQIAEFDVPEKQYRERDTGVIDNEGEAVMAREALPLDLSTTNIAVWELPA